MPIKRISISQANYLFLIGYLSYTIYDNIVTQNYYIPIKFVCYSVLVYSTILLAYSTAKYSIANKDFMFVNLPMFVKEKEN